jgi:phenylacetate-coenzyme A ligase PaaK-like adenylate-forming protein
MLDIVRLSVLVHKLRLFANSATPKAVSEVQEQRLRELLRHAASASPYMRAGSAASMSSDAS